MPDNGIRSYADIKGWFFWADRMMFDLLLDAQEEPGALVELGAYLGRSAVIIGDHVRSGERFVVVDLFGSDAELDASAEDAANRAENRYSYATLTRAEFERNYLALHVELPEVVQAPSSAIVNHVPAGSVRFLHIDASHLYPQVAQDIRNARTVLQPNGVVAFDDYSNPNTPGVAGAVWEAVATQGLIPFAVTQHKLYGTWGEPAKHLDTVRAFVAGEDRIGCSEQQVLGHSVLRLKVRSQPPAASVPPTPPAREPAAPALDPAALDAIAAGLARRIAPPLRRSDWVPPIAARWIRSRRLRRSA
jgi:hypothetical protein